MTLDSRQCVTACFRHVSRMSWRGLGVQDSVVRWSKSNTSDVGFVPPAPVDALTALSAAAERSPPAHHLSVVYSVLGVLMVFFCSGRSVGAFFCAV